PRYLTIYLGTNDAGFIYPDVILSNLQYIVERAKANGTIPVIATLGPSIYDWAWKTSDTLEVNRRIRQLAASQGIACADIDVALGWNHSYMADGLHPNDAGHQIIADTFYNALTR
ncbi:MAG: SGNH/GDSL hydrolase family protein, partial [Syntrophaceae bacterium]|nr:SGNH/GDSL hydrolase family protein [Syntrophaceae bacterium]